MKRLFIVFALFVFLPILTFGQMQKFPKQNPDITYTASFLISNQNIQLFYWFDNNRLLQSRSLDGINWSDTVALVNYIDPTHAEITGNVLNTGRIYLVYKYQWFSSIYSDDNGQTWSTPVKLPTGTTISDQGKANNGSFIQSSSGKYIFTYSKVSAGVSYIKFITSSNNGSTWSAEQTFGSGPVKGSISTTSNNKLILVYQYQGLFSSFSTNDGITWDSSKTIISGDTTVNTPKIVRDQTGQLWLFYQRYVPSPFTGISQLDIMYKISTDNGVTWSAENNFTKYKGFDGYFNISANGNNALVTFSSDRRDSANTIYNLWYGTAGFTNDDNAPTCVYKYDVSNPSPQPGEQFKIDVYIDYITTAPTIFLSRNIGGILQPPLEMYDDGTRGDSAANDKIYTCEVPGMNLGDGMLAEFVITDQELPSFLFKGPKVVIPYANSISTALIDVNRFKLPVGNNGVLGDILINGYSGGRYDGNIVMFSGGFYLTGISNGVTWSNGEFSAARIIGYLPGRVGTIPEDPKNILYTVRSTDPSFGQAWQDWKIAVSQGAGFYDGNKDGIYNPVDLNGNGQWDPNEDRPDFLGDMTIWCVYNDGLPGIQRYYESVNPQGIEIQQTVFAQKDSADLNNVVFIRYRLINRGTAADVLDSVYFGIADDSDIGDSGANDLGGCDTLLNSVYTFHRNGSGDTKWGNSPPAETITLIQGPVSYIPGVTFVDINGNGIYDQGTDVPIDTAYSLGGPLMGKTVYPGAKNLNMTSANDYFKSTEPQTSLQIQRTLMGRNCQDGKTFDPCTFTAGIVLGGVNCGDVNPFYLYSGDPITQMGWVDNVPRDQRNLLNTGPFKLEKNKPVDVIVAEIVGRGSDPLNSIAIAKQYAVNTIAYYNTNFANSIITGVRDLPQIVNKFNLFQNYPNPFNPSTIIKYSIGQSSQVSIKVYNILGREVAVLMNEQKNPGEYELTFNSAKYNLASGVYFYKLSGGGFTSAKKMLLIK